MIKNDTVENKLDSISKFVASLKSNLFTINLESMKNHSDNSSIDFKTKDFLMGEPEYLKLREQVERFRMREE